MGRCLAIYPATADDRIEVPFALERVYLRRSGTTTITVDLLVRNIGPRPISCLRIAMPYSFTDIRKLSKSKRPMDVSAFTDLRAHEPDNIKVCTSELLRPEAETNWIYHTVPHVRLRLNGAEVEVVRSRPAGLQPLRGWVKKHWIVQALSDPPANNWMWFLFAVNGITVLDVKAQEDDKQEHLQSQESMWLRLHFDLPADGLNKHSTLQRFFSLSLDYHQTFKSPAAVRNWIRDVIDKFEVDALPIDATSRGHLVTAQMNAIPQLPDRSTSSSALARAPLIGDWRIFMFKEFGVSFEQVTFSDPPPRHMRHVYQLPLAAYSMDSRLGLGPRWVYRLFRRQPRCTICEEAWVGVDHNCTNPEGYVLELEARINKAWPTWAAILLALLALVPLAVDWGTTIVRYLTRNLRVLWE